MKSVISVQEWSLLIWITLLLTGAGLATKVNAIVIKGFFISSILRLLLFIGTSKTLALLGALNVSIFSEETHHFELKV